MKIGAVIREHREALGISQMSVAAALGVSRGYLCQVEKERVRLADKHFRNLPSGIREPATEAAMRELGERAKIIMGES